MIYFLVPRDGAPLIENYLAGWGKGLAGRLNVVPYEDLPSRTDYPGGTYVFAGFDQLSPVQRHAFTGVASQLESASADVSILNRPALTLLRYDLLRTLQQVGINRFGATRAANAASVTRYPVFIRKESAHNGSLSGLLYSLGDVDRWLCDWWLRGNKLRDLLIVDFAETRDSSGLFHKYSAFVVGDAVVPRSLYFGKDWMLKSRTREVDEEKLLAERAYVMDNPHETILRRIFVTAHIEYGRIDYSVVGRQIFAWEINLNPTIGRAPREPTASPCEKATRSPGWGCC
ncbi:MAG: hypothetical protein IH997_13750 [Proteobacteria bacterium]|nr:hypothetical protein [Pseudomonadota bacterium]